MENLDKCNFQDNIKLKSSVQQGKQDNEEKFTKCGDTFASHITEKRLVPNIINKSNISILRNQTNNGQRPKEIFMKRYHDQ